MKKIIISGAVIVLFGAYAFFLRSKNDSTPVNIENSVPSETTNPDASNTDSTPVATTPPPTDKPTKSSKWKDGTYTGTSIDFAYGKLQVAAVISGGKLTDVKFLDYPKVPETSLRKSNNAIPILKSEAIASQSANVNINSISGATDDIPAFNKSLASALALAKS